MIPESFDNEYTIIQSLIPHADQAFLNNLRQFKNCPNIESLISILLNQLDITQKDVIDLQRKLNLEIGTGDYLNKLGKELGRGREGSQSDDDYRFFLYTQILKNTNQTTVNEVLHILTKLIQSEISDNKIFLTESYPARVIATIQTEENIQRVGSFKGIDSLLPAGVNTEINIFPDECMAFGLEGSGGAPLDLGCWASRYREINLDYTPFGLDTGFPLDIGRFIDIDVGITIDPIQQASDEDTPPPTLLRDSRVLGFYPSGGEITT